MRTEKEIDADIKALNDKMRALNLEKNALRAKKRRSSSQNYKNTKQLLEAAGPLWNTVVGPEDFVKVTGSRAGTVRKVIEIRGGYLYGATCNLNRQGQIVHVNEMKIIECGTNKITARLLNDGTWETARQVIDKYS